MTLKVEVISKETIKPSSPTPDHQKIHKLSLIDQYNSSFPVCTVFFYPATHGDLVQPDCLKKSLAETLAQFYPLAGRLVDGNLFIDCNDEGVNFFEARVFTQLSSVLSNPMHEELDQLIPTGLKGPKELLSIQLIIFECGGMVLGVGFSHKSGDASSFSLFLNRWAAVTRGDNETISPIFDMSSLFPPKEQEVTHFVPPMPTIKVVSKKFIFNASNIAALKAECSSSLYVEQPTRVEAVSALLWKCAMNAASHKQLLLAMDLRGRMVPPLNNLSYGNLVMCTVATSEKESHSELQFLVGQLREAKRKIDSEYMKKLQYGDGIANAYDFLNQTIVRSIRGEVAPIVISSWLRFRFNEVDFGSGKPVWLTVVNTGAPNVVFLQATECRKGVEACVSLAEEEMARFECDPQLVAFTSAD